MEQRPAALFVLDATQVVGNAPLAHLIDIAEKVLEHDVLGRNGRIGFELENPVAVWALRVPHGLALRTHQLIKRSARNQVVGQMIEGRGAIAGFAVRLIGYIRGLMIAVRSPAGFRKSVEESHGLGIRLDTGNAQES